MYMFGFCIGAGSFSGIRLAAMGEPAMADGANPAIGTALAFERCLYPWGLARCALALDRNDMLDALPPIASIGTVNGCFDFLLTAADFSSSLSVATLSSRGGAAAADLLASGA